MLSIIKDFLTGSPEPWQIVAGLVLLVLLVAQRLSSIRKAWINYRKGLSDLTFEKHQLEVTKLRYEIAVLKKSHDLGEIPLPSPPVETVKEGEKASPPSPMWGWLVKHPVFGEITLRFLQVIVGFYCIAFAVGTVIMPFANRLYEDASLRTTDIVVMSVIYGLLTYACYKGYRRIRARVRELQAASQK